MNEPDVLLVYDHQCPVCHAYCTRVRLRPDEGQLRLIDARDPSPILEEITRAGLDIDQGMVVQTQGRLYYGADAIHELSLLADRSTIFNRLSYWAFRWNWAARLIYPVLRFLRNLLLKVLGRTKINNLSLPHNDRF